MTDNGGRRTARRIVTGLGVVAAGSIILPSGIAHAEPEQTQEEAEQRLAELQEEADSVVQDYNQAKEDYDAAKKKVDELEKQVGDEEDRYNELRDKVAQFASAAYQGTDVGSTTNILASDDPSDILDQSADIGYLSESQQAELEEFAGSSERLIKLKQEAEDALKEAEEQKEEAEEKKDEVEEKIAEQEELLAQFPGADPTDDGSVDSSGGATYTGSASGSAATALDFAYAQIGKPYVWGGAGPDGFDCSGLTMRAWGAAGVSLPRTTYGQAEVGQRVSRDALQPGDLLFFSDLGHVGMYVGNNQMVHAPRTGKNIEITSLAGYWDGQYQFAVRP
ncbi:NlpC/P60 family protein [Marinactinospora thermotolerans]|uniref:Cell wall-associated hydrolase, NlpC family n=1 Tax=Marinactinospora thermotolerans DSM 45154 TaxID=1122192 RepID=A0A1T4MEV8_9ACTN|nr:NlpC/P60 family protein [Marinactinospora thermotolerans]SJZ65421.1 Cell wall-associated hydrolase, NlpC family [Marinactinospora thermotolerans DSM 45154]